MTQGGCGVGSSDESGPVTWGIRQAQRRWGTRAYGPLAGCKPVSLRRQAGSIPAFPTIFYGRLDGRVTQLARVPLLQGGSSQFESGRAYHFWR